MRIIRIEFIGLLFLVIIGCGKPESDENTQVKPNRVEETQIQRSNNGWKGVSVGDSIHFSVPKNWQIIESDNFTIKDDCNESFCSNLIVYQMENVDQYYRLELAQTFVESLAGNYNNFKLINSEVNTPDSSMISFDYLLTSQGLKLGGTTYIYIRSNSKALVFSFMGYNGNNGDYVDVRGIITKIVETIEFD